MGRRAARRRHLPVHRPRRRRAGRLAPPRGRRHARSARGRAPSWRAEWPRSAAPSAELDWPRTTSGSSTPSPQLELMVAELQVASRRGARPSEPRPSATVATRRAAATRADRRRLATRSTSLTVERDEYRASFDVLAGVQEELVAVRRSESFRIGRLLLSPIVTTRRFVRAWRRAEVAVADGVRSAQLADDAARACCGPDASRRCTSRHGRSTSATRSSGADAARSAGRRIPLSPIGIERPDIAERFRADSAALAYARTSGLIFAGVVGPLEPGPHPFELDARR